MASESPDKCPVEPQTRQKWLDAAKARGQPDPAHPSPLIPPASPPAPGVTARQLRKAEDDPRLLEQLTPQILRLPQEQRNILLEQWQHLRAMSELHAHGLTKYSLDALQWIPKTTISQPRRASHRPTPTLSTTREISTIPRALPTPHDKPLNHAELATLPPSNSEQDTGHDRESGNWIYPSQSQFFAAMQRKGHNPQTEDMSTLVPLHNAVNERAWHHILAWEKKSDTSGNTLGPKLVSFQGDSKKLSPRAWWLGLWGGVRPFDRHDWVVERASGGRVEYVIDFYEGKKGVDGAGNGASGAPVSFYLDVRPKLNSWEGVKTRVGRTFGL